MRRRWTASAYVAAIAGVSAMAAGDALTGQVQSPSERPVAELSPGSVVVHGLGPTAVIFAPPELGNAFLAERDAFLAALSPFDREVRLESSEPVSEVAFRAHLARRALPWEAAQRRRVLDGLADVGRRLGALGLRLPLPSTILFIQTDGKEEANAPYTRRNAIILPRRVVGGDGDGDPGGGGGDRLSFLLAHELFHIISRHDPALRTAAYATIGFQPCGELDFPPGLAPIKITNPDAPQNDHMILVRAKAATPGIPSAGVPIPVMPVLYSSRPRYDPSVSRGLFGHLEMRLLVLAPAPEPGPGATTGAEAGSNPTAQALLHAGEPVLLKPPEVEGFFEKVGRNTGYILHPEETLADHFAYLVLGRQDLPDPEKVEALRRLLVSRGRDAGTGGTRTDR